VLSNCDAYYNPVQSNWAPNVLAYTLYDRLLGLQATDWNAHQVSVFDELSAAISIEQVTLSDGQTPAHPGTCAVDAYAGIYEHPGYGRVAVENIDGRLKLTLNGKITFRLEHVHNEIFDAIFEVTGQRPITFEKDPDGKSCRLAVRLEPKVKEIVFNRRSG
jgi:hypothetical protein